MSQDQQRLSENNIEAARADFATTGYLHQTDEALNDLLSQSERDPVDKASQSTSIGMHGRVVALALLTWLLAYGAALDQEPIAEELLLAEGTRVVRARPLAQPPEHRAISPAGNDSVVDLDYQLGRDLLFWIAGSRVFSCQLSSCNESRVIVDRGLGDWRPLALAVDFVGERLYVADALGRKLDAFSLSGKNHLLLATEGLDGPSDVVLDPPAALAFVADSDKIWRMNLDGSAAHAIVRKSVPLSIGSLALDPQAKSVFWWDADLGALESCGYVGDARRVLRRATLLTGLTHCSGRLFFSAAGLLHQLHDGAHSADGLPLESAGRLRALSPEAQRGAEAAGEPCAQGNAGCQQACLLAGPGIARCACYAGQRLAEDSRGCEPAGALLLYSHAELVRGRPVSQVEGPIAFSSASAARLALSLAPDYEGNALYFADANSNSICRTDLEAGVTETLLTYEGSASLSLDWASRNLYYSDLVAGSISVLSLREPRWRRRLLDGLSSPSELQLHPRRGLLFFYEGGSVKRARADGSDLVELYRPRPHRSLRLALDADEERLYWSLNDLERAASNASIQHARLDGSDVQTLRASPQLRDVSGLLVHGPWIYAVTAAFEQLLRLSKADGSRVQRLAPAEHRPFHALAVLDRPAELERRPCASGGCDKLCLAVPRSKGRPGLARSCRCPQGERLAGRSGEQRCRPEGQLKELSLVHRCEADWEFTCRNGRCVPRSQLCDGVNDCLDRSDERGCAGAEARIFG